MTKTTALAKRRFLFYALMLAVAIILLVGAGVLSVWLPYHREQPAIAAIKAVGGRVDIKPGGPDWLREWVGDEYMTVFERVDSVYLRNEPIDDGILKHVSNLTNLWYLNLDFTKISDAGLELLASLAHLKILSLFDTPITDAGLEHLSELNNLESLSLGLTQISDAGLEHLAGLSKLKVLDLAGTQITDAGLVHLGGLTNLESLSLVETQITHAGVKQIASLTKLMKQSPKLGQTGKVLQSSVSDLYY